MILMGVELGFCKHVYIPPSRMAFKTDLIFSAGIQRFDSFLSKISEVKRLSKVEIRDDWIESRKIIQGNDFSVQGIKNIYNSIIGNAEQPVRTQQSNRSRDFLAVAVGLSSIFVTEDGVLVNLDRRDRDAQA